MDWGVFRRWLENSFSYTYAKDVYNYSKRYYGVLFSRDASILLGLSGSVRKSVMASLSNLSKFLGIHKKWKELIENYGLKWGNADAANLIISRMMNTEKNGDVIKWIKAVRQQIPKLQVFLDFMIASGLRYREAVNSFNLIIQLTKEGKLSEYYNVEGNVLEHFRFKRLFIRRSKKAFITFLDEELTKRISRQRRLTEAQINNWIRRNGFKSRFGDIREFYATFMTRWLTQPEIDFLQGRVSTNVFMINYFNPALIVDLKDRVLEGTASLKALRQKRKS